MSRREDRVRVPRERPRRGVITTLANTTAERFDDDRSKHPETLVPAWRNYRSDKTTGAVAVADLSDDLPTSSSISQHAANLLR